MTPQELQEAIRKDPVIGYDHILGCAHWSMQDKITRAVFKFQRVTVKGCHGFGKSYSAARIGIDYFISHLDCIVVTTAPTFRQVENIIWREWRGAVAKAKVPIGGKVLKTQHEFSENWYAIGLSSDKPDAFQGIHSASGHILVVVDEASGMPHDILQVIEALLTSADVHLLYIGNPTRGEGLFYESFKNQFFYKISVSVFDTPNFKKNKIKSVQDLKRYEDRDEVANLPLVYKQLVTPLWAWERMHDWGEDSPIFQSRVLAQFPEESDDTLIPLFMVENALDKEFSKEDQLLWNVEKCIGIDVARFGDDKSVFTAVRSNNKGEYDHLDTEWYGKKDTMEIVGRAIVMFDKLKFRKIHDLFVVDDTGVGGGVSDRLAELGYNVMRVNFGSGADDERFVNIKGELFWNLRELFKDGKIKLLDRGEMCAQIPLVRYDYTSNGKIFIVSKKDMKKKGLGSPDFADSLALACFGFARSDVSVYLSDKEKDKKGGTIGGNILNQSF